MSKSCMNQIVDKPIECDFSCLIEREDALSKVQSFLEMLTGKERGILRVVGNRGTGRTRLLNEIAQKAAEYSFEVGFINTGEKSSELSKGNGYLTIDTEKVDIVSFEKHIISRLQETKNSGFVLIIDNALSMNNSDLSFVQKFLTSEIPVKLGLVYSIDPDNVFSLDYIDIDLCDTVCINALSPKGVQMWIKNILAWDEAPKSFLKWLYSETKGLPKLLQENVSCLLQNGFLIYNPDNNWTVVGNFCDMDKSDKNDGMKEVAKDKLSTSQTGSFENELRLTNGMGHLWNTWKYWNESLTRLKEIIKRQEAIPKLENVRLYIWFGQLTNLDSEYEQAIGVLNDGLELFRKTTDKEGEAEILYMKALVLSTQGNLTKVSIMLVESLASYRLIDDKPGITRVHQYLGLVNYYQGEYEKAELFLVESLEICRRLKDKLGTSRSLVRLGMVAKGKGNFEQAIKLFDEHLKICEDLDDKEGISNALINIAEMSMSRHNYSFARDYYERSLKLVREMGYKVLVAHTLKDLGEIARYEGDFDKASWLFLESMDVLEECGDNVEIMWLYHNMAELEVQKQSYSAAKDLFLKGLKVFRDSGQTTWIYVMAVFEALAEIAFALEELTRAARLIGAADRLFEVTGKLIAKNDFAQFYIRHWRIQEKMNKEAFEAAWSEGNIMNLNSALDYAMEEMSGSVDSDMAEKMINYIKANYSNDISLTDISEYFDMSPCYLSTMFKHYTGENFKDYLNFYRVKKAKEYLQNGKMKMGTVAKMVGCNSINTFIRIFKKYEGISPGQYVVKK